jgi:hypothetical protein
MMQNSQTFSEEKDKIFGIKGPKKAVFLKNPKLVRG